MLSNVSIYTEKYEPNKIYYDKHGTSCALMPLDDGSYVVGKGTAMPVAFSSDVGTADDEVEPIRARFLNSANRLKETLRFENFTDLQRFLWGRTENICEGVVLCCYEKSDAFCHRHILADYISEKFAIEIEEVSFEIK